MNHTRPYRCTRKAGSCGGFRSWKMILRTVTPAWYGPQLLLSCLRLNTKGPEPCGTWTQLHPVRMLSPTTFCEAIILLICRDHAHVGGRYHHWCKMWRCLIEKRVQLIGQ
ncbi:uncharacterized protein BDV17DRAFT_255838 [Aspergillus undulatus]|uniref:uncharacterized protein n=1 Tax=Aspergillus undulatus TaxID=1810928 RepID=UPI003CCE3539